MHSNISITAAEARTFRFHCNHDYASHRSYAIDGNGEHTLSHIYIKIDNADDLRSIAQRFLDAADNWDAHNGE